MNNKTETLEVKYDKDGEMLDVIDECAKAEFNALRKLKGLPPLSDQEILKDNKALSKVFKDPVGRVKHTIEASNLREHKKMNGRIETYIHGDSSTPNKGGVMIKVSCDSDFAAKTPEFINLCEDYAMFIFGVVSVDESHGMRITGEGAATAVISSPEEIQAVLKGIDSIDPDFNFKKMEVEKNLKEKIKVDHIAVMWL